LQSSRVEIDCMPIMIKRLTFTGSTLRPRSVEEKAAIAQALLAKVWPLFEAKKIHAVIHAIYPRTDARQAHELMESSTHIGKILLSVKGG
jgi:NADPH2:quinone reductase